MRSAVNRVELKMVAVFAKFRLLGFRSSLQNRGPFYCSAKPGCCCTIYAAHPDHGLVSPCELNL